ncbi:MAG: rod-binding protein [Desulfobacula sp.]|jgi:flagellar protein FlgJ|nr:rod-binding protein [Desulfobacula sp.]
MTDKIDLMHQNLTVASLNNIKKKAIDPEKAKELEDACAGFESIFLKQMMESMRTSLPGNGLFEESNATNIYTSMQDQNIAESVSKGRQSIGIRDFLYHQLKESI